MAETLYFKRGRKYVVLGHAEDYRHDLLRAGEWRLTYCYEDGAQRYSYGVTPDIASFTAACQLAGVAMEQAIAEAAKAKPDSAHQPREYTKAQMALIEKFRADMAAAGGLVPDWWEHSSARDIAQAGIDAVRNWKG